MIVVSVQRLVRSRRYIILVKICLIIQKVYVPPVDNRNAEAFVFLNYYLDFTNAIADGQNDVIDDTDLQGTDFPTNVPLPHTVHVENEQHEQVREWILTNAMDRDVSQVKGKNSYNILYCFSARVQSTNDIVWALS
ncbi:unnamed protein product [Macrosiphum euphorbiae]|uniref:Uncharacterized protein n=1 Tax=Macrosiphum euphorbiae TaxID=13131 RepID=A0AAV0WBG5_9HEMI|nr:unnamed protein product [Macrosiphum euphorbiae]